MDKNSAWITFPDLLIWLPLVAGLVSFVLRKDRPVKAWALFISFLTLMVSATSLFYTKNMALNNAPWSWMPGMGAGYTIALDGLGRILTFLTALSFPLVFVATYKNEYANSNNFYGLMLLTQAGLMGVFCTMDALAFYFFWELALIPAYFLCSRWGGEKRIAATFKFFIYTFTGSLLLLVGIIYIYLQTAPVYGSTGVIVSQHSFSLSSFYAVHLLPGQQKWLFWLFFIAFAIKMPVFPFHTWQPDVYEQAPTATTMVLSGVMVKMGVFALLRWLLPIFPVAVLKFDHIVIILSVIGMLYASLIAYRQDDLKRLVAYSSIAHMGLMCAAVFSGGQTGMQGVMIQLFNHGINIIGLWIVVEAIETQTGVRKISQLGGIANQAPALTIFLVVIALANIALPLTNGFTGEFMMFSGLFKFNVWFAAIAGISIILAAVYVLKMVQQVFYGESNALTAKIKDIGLNQQLALGIIVVFIFVLGVYPQPVFDLAKETVTAIYTRFK